MTFGFHPEVMPVIRGPNPNNGPGSLHPLTEAMASVQAGPHSALLHLTNRVPLGCFGRAGGCLVQGRIVRKMVKAGTFSKGLNMGSRHLTKCSVGTCTLPNQATPYRGEVSHTSKFPHSWVTVPQTKAESFAAWGAFPVGDHVRLENLKELKPWLGESGGWFRGEGGSLTWGGLQQQPLAH